MVSIKKVEKKEGGDWHVRYRSPSQFIKIRTPRYARRAARDISKGADVRVGKTPAGNWLVQSVVLEPEGIRDANHAKSLAARIRKEIEE